MNVIMTVLLYAAGLGTALAGMIANAAGLTIPGGDGRDGECSFWLFATLTMRRC